MNRISGRTVAFPSNIKTITWNANGGTGGTTWQRIVGDVIGNPMPNANKTGNTSVGWFNTSSATGGTRVKPLTIMPNSNTTYWARWPIWHADRNYVGFWPGTINTYTQTIGTTSTGFQFSTRVSEARTAWNSVLGMSIGTGTSSSAQIRVYGGSRVNLAAFLNIQPYNLEWEGMTDPATETLEGTLSVNGSTRTVYRFSGQSYVYIVEISTGTTWSQENINLTKNTVTHELGHALGYRGHSPWGSANEQDVMWYIVHSDYTLKTNEKRHLRQIYDRYR